VLSIVNEINLIVLIQENYKKILFFSCVCVYAYKLAHNWRFSDNLILTLFKISILELLTRQVQHSSMQHRPLIRHRLNICFISFAD